MNGPDVVVIGAGPAGLTAAYELVKNGRMPLVLESADKVGGLARTEVYRGYRFDIGGHRFYTKVDEVQRLWEEVMGADFMTVPRLSRIYYQGRYFQYPLELFNALTNMGPVESIRIMSSYVRARLSPRGEEHTFEQWVTHRFGRRLYKMFFQAYTEKVWGIPCNKIHAEWAAQRIKGLSLRTTLMNAAFQTNTSKSLIREFQYPTHGPGMMWERFSERVEGLGGEVKLNTEVVGFVRSGTRISGVVTRRDGKTETISGEHIISSMPIDELILKIDPPPPAAVTEAARQLKHRDFILVGLIINQPVLFPDNWIYVHSPGVRVGRIQNYKNWSAAMVADARKSNLGMEYFCSVGDDLWTMSDEELIALARRDLEALGLGMAEDIEDGFVIRQPKAYPVYDQVYRSHLEVIQGYLCTLENLQTIGRNGMHRYNNQDHSMLTGIKAARNLMGEQHDLWNVNTERSYYEEFASS